MVDQTKFCLINFNFIVMLIGPLETTENQPVDMLYALQGEPLLGAQRNKLQLHSQLQKLNTLPPHMLQSKYCGIVHFFENWTFPYQKKTTIFLDNQAAISIVHHLQYHAHKKHINIAYHFLRDLVKCGTLNIVYINTMYNLVDLFTKRLPWVILEELTYEIGVLAD